MAEDTLLPRPDSPIPENICKECKGAGENVVDGRIVECEPCNGTGLTAGTHNLAEVLRRSSERN